MDIHDQETEGGSLADADTAGAGETFGRYENLKLLGEGGMARVYRAYDPTLGRAVALKFIKGEDPDLAQRLLMEARSQARIEHKHVCKVYEAGQIDGRPYIAMQLIHGRSLNTLYEELSLEQKLTLVVEVTNAVHVAHRAGLIHRDLKPANILVERTGAGEWIPYVMDFGLARETAAPGLTATGTIVGSPWYMPPEQARGDVRSLDRRSDVYSLGATLYQLISGRLPFEGEGTVNVLMRVLQEEPTPLSHWKQQIPADLDAIVMKCLEKEPGRRYDSARALAEDLQRYLDGEPVHARPSGLLYRFSKRVRKNKVTYFSGAVALLAVIVFGLVALNARISASRHAALANEFGQIVKDMEWRMRVSHMAPLHDIRPEKEQVSKRLETIRSGMTEVGEAGAGLRSYALGRGEMALGNFREARRHLDEAWQNQYRTPEVAFALGYTLSVLYRQERLEAEKISNDQLRAARLLKITQEFRDPARNFLEIVRTNDPGFHEFVEGLLAYYEQDYPLALQKAQHAVNVVPWLYEALTLEGDVYAALHTKELVEGDAVRAEESRRKSEESYLAAIRIGQSDPEVRHGLCAMRANTMAAKFFEGGDLEPEFRGSVEACTDALVVDPDNAAVHAEFCGVYRVWGEYQAYLGNNPASYYRQAEQYGRRALEINPNEARFHALMSNLFRVKAEFEQEHGTPSDHSLALTFEYQKKAVALNPKDGTILNGMGNAFLVRALDKYMKGDDVRPDAAEATVYYGKALQETPGFSYVLNNLGIANAVISWYEIDHGTDPEKSSTEAINFFRQSIRQQPENETPYFNLGILYRRLGELSVLQGRDPGPLLEKAREIFLGEIKVNPESTGDVFAEQGAVELAAARYQLDQGRSPETELQRTTGYLSKALKVRPDLWNAHQGMGEARLVEAQWKIHQGEDPSQTFGLALSSLVQAVKVGSTPGGGVAALPLSVAKAHYQRACWKMKRNRAVQDDIRAGLEMVERAASMNPNEAEVFGIRGSLLLLQIQDDRSDDNCKSAREDVQQAVALNAFLGRKYHPILEEIAATCMRN